jgi:hypothetical protein
MEEFESLMKHDGEIDFCHGCSPIYPKVKFYASVISNLKIPATVIF